MRRHYYRTMLAFAGVMVLILGLVMEQATLTYSKALICSSLLLALTTYMLFKKISKNLIISVSKNILNNLTTNFIILFFILFLLSFSSILQAQIISTGTGGDWSISSTWQNGVVPVAGDDVIITNGTNVTISSATSCNSLTINGTLSISGSNTLAVNGDWTNNGTFTANTSAVNFTGTGNVTISGSSTSAFHDIIINKGTDVNSIIEANGGGALSNTGSLTIIHGLFKMTTGTFKFGGNSLVTIPASGGIWVNGAIFNSGDYSITNEGLIRVTTGIANFGTQSGNSVHTQFNGVFEVIGGTVNIAGRLENTAGGTLPETEIKSGITISGGTVTLSTVGNGEADTGTLDVSTLGYFDFSGGTIIFKNASSAINAVDLHLVNGSGNGAKLITGGTFEMGNADTPTGSTFVINSEVPLSNLTTSANANIALGNDLIISGTLDLHRNLVLNDYSLRLPVAAPKLFYYPLKYASGNLPLNIDITSGTFSPGAYIELRMGEQKHPQNANEINYLKRYWTINTSGISNLNYNLEAHYVDGDVAGNEASFIVGSFNGSKWANRGNPDIGANTITISGITDNSSSFAALSIPTVGITPSSTTICEGASVTLLSNASGDPVINYSWTSSPSDITSTDANVTVSPAVTTIYTVTITDGNGLTATDNSTLTVTPANTITLSSGSGTNNQTECINTAITPITWSTTGATGATVSGLPTGVNGAWSGNVVTISGTPSTTVGSPFDYTVTLTGGCGTVTATGTITVTPDNTITLTSAGGTTAQTVCINTAIINITYSTTGATGATFSGLPTGVTGTWVSNVVTISGTPSTTVGSPFDYTITLIGGCGAVTTTGSISVIPLITPSVTISANPGGNICAGTSVTFTATPGNAGPNPAYQWKKNGSDITGANSSTYTSSALANTDKITVVITSDAPCPVSARSINEITMTVNALQTPTVTITESANPICQGTSVTFTAIAINGGSSPSYQWQVNSVPAGSSTTFTTTSLANNDQVNLVLTSSALCAINPATSNTITMTVNPVLIPSVTISASETTICPGTQVTFTAAPTNEGASPSYQWKLNGGNVGTNSPTFTSTTLANGNAVSIVLSSNATCASPATANSNNIAMTVNPATPATPGTISGLTLVCPDATGITYSIAAVSNATTYTWTVPAGWSITGGLNTTAITVTAGTTGQNGNITVTAGNSCGTSAEKTVAVTVGSLSSPPTGVTITNNNTCNGTSKTLTVTGGSLGTGATWQWFTGSCGGTAAGTGATIVVNPAPGTSTTYFVRASGTCNTTLCAEGTVVVSPGAPVQPGAITGTTSVCPGITGLIYSITAVPDATSYTWTVPAGWSINAGAGTNSITVTSGSAGQNGNISITASNSCGISSPGTLAVTVSPGTPATPGIISGAAEQCINKTGLIYSIVAVPNATSYAWTVPAGWTITSGAGTTSITVSTGAGALSGNITVTASNSCGISGTKTLAVIANTAIPLAPATPTGPTSICDIATGLVFTVPTVANATSYNWQLPSGWNITSGSATNTITVVLTAGAQNGDQNITVTASNSCGTSAPSAVLTVAVGSFATAYAGIDQTICFNTANITVNGTPGGAANKNKGTWSTSGTGAFGDATKPGPTTYTPSAADKTAGSVTLTFTTDNPAGLCVAASDFLILTIRPVPVVSISGTTTICSGTSSTITFNATPNTIVSYTISGAAGTSTINIGSGGTAVLTTILSSSTTYSLVSAAYTVAPTCSQALSGSAIVTVNQIATVNAGADQTVCSLSPAVTLAGSIGGTATSGTWNGGSGTFNPNNTTLNAVYTPTAAEIAAGTVGLTLTTDDPAGPCPAASDQVVISINPAATVNAGPDQTICTGSAITLAGSVVGGASSGTWSGGTGSFTPNANTLNAVYTPGVAEVAAGSVTLTLTTNDPAGPCSPATDQVLITINPLATANAGPDQTICAGSTFVLAGTVGGGAFSGTWSGGAGTFNPDNTTLNAIYTPTSAETTAGSLTLTLTSNDPIGPCPAASDQVALIINPNPTANAGPDLVICAGSTATLAGSIGGSASSGSWSGGTGSFSPNPNTLNAVYTPGAADIAAGSAILTLTTNDPSGVCTAVSDQVSVTINPMATVSAGPNLTICSNTTATMAGSFGGGATSGTWSTNKNGTFNNNSPSAIYSPGNSDINSGNVTLTYTTNDPAGSCGQVSSSMTLTIKKAVVITDQPSNTGVCESNPAEFRVGAIGDALIYQWYKGLAPGGTAVLNSSNITGAQSTILHFNQASLTDDGSYYVVVSGASPCSPAISNQVTLNVDKAITITTQPAAQTVCIGTNVTFSVVADANGDPLTYQWFKGIVPGGTPVSDSGTVSGALTATLTINNVAPGDAGNYYAVITGQPGYTCTFVNSAVALLTVPPNVANPVFASGATSTRCQGAGIETYSASASNSTGITYGLDATSTGAGNSINTSTGAVTYVGTWSGTSIITTTAAGCNGPKIATHTVTVNPTVGTPATPAPPNTTICQASAPTTYKTSATDATSYTWSVTGTGNTIAGTGTTATVTWAAGFSGSATISVVANGCNGPSAPATTTVLVTPTVGVPTAPSPSNTTICQASAPTTYTTSANNATSYTWSITGSGNSITGTGTSATVTWAAGFTGSATVSVQANGCNGPSASASSTVTVTPTVLTPVFSLGPTSTRCQGTGSVTYTATATNTTGITYTLDAASITGGNSIVSNTGVVTYADSWSGSTTITASAAGCNGPATATHTININPTSNGGTISPALSTVCTTTNTGTLTLSGQFGSITRWESSSNSGISWVTISNTTNMYNFSNLPQTTMFRAVIQSGICPLAYSSIARVDVIPVFTPIITATAGDLCAGQSATLTATIGGIVPPGPFTGGLFNQANPEGWVVTQNGTVIKFPANADNTNIGPWSETNGPRFFNGIEYNSGDGKFAIVNGNTNSTLETPVFSLLAMPTAVLTWEQAYNLFAGTSGRIELSLDGGLTYNIVLAQYTGPVTFGNPKAFSSMNIDLASYLGQSNMRIRFNYTGSAGSSWAIDNVGMPGQQPDITYVWSPTATLSPTTGSVVTATPGSTTTYTLTMYISGCPGTATAIVINVVNNPVVTTTNACIGGGTVTFTQTNGPPGGTWTVSGGGTITSGGVFTPTTAGCFNATYTTAAASCSDTKSFVVFPAAPVLTSPVNTCAGAFILPVVAPVSGFTTEYSIDEGAFTTAPSLPSSYGCHTISARYLLTATCGPTVAGSMGTGPCGPGNTVSVVIFPPTPPAPIVNAGCGPITVTSPTVVPGFTIEYSFNNGGIWGINNPPTNDNCIGYRIKTRYVTSTACGAISAGTVSPIAACSESPATLRTLDITAPSITFCPPAQSFCEVSGNLYTIPALSASDICSGTLEITYQITGATIKNDGAGNDASGIYNVGMSTITWTVKDACGNTSTCTTQVTINPLPVTSPIYHR